MGIIKAVAGAVGGTLADQWLEVVDTNSMGDTTVFARGVPVRRGARGSNSKGTADYLTDGSIIHVYPNQFMMVVDGGKVTDYSAEEGYYRFSSASTPSMFNGSLDASIAESFDRIRYGGISPIRQQVFYINLQEIKGIKFGTRSPVNYFDSFYNAELFLRAHGTYSIKIVDPLRFYAEAIPHNKDNVDIREINGQYVSEFLEAFASAINQLSADGVRISHVASKGPELGRYMSTILDEDWRKMRGMEIVSVGIASISYDQASAELINMRNQGAMLSDAGVRQGYIQGAAARGMETAAASGGGNLSGMMGFGLAAQMANNLFQQAGAANAKANPAADSGWLCSCGARNTGKFCQNCGKPRAAQGGWACACGQCNSGNFCQNCGNPRPAPHVVQCKKCGFRPDSSKAAPKFCPQCGDPIGEEDIVP